MKFKRDKNCQKDAEITRDCVLQDAPKNEQELLKSLNENGFDGYQIKQRKSGEARVYAEIHGTNPDLFSMGWVYFNVPSCRKFYERDREGYIINIGYFAK